MRPTLGVLVTWFQIYRSLKQNPFFSVQGPEATLALFVKPPPPHWMFLAKKNGQVGGGVQSSSNFSPSVAITFISSQCILGCTESNVSQKKQTSISQIPWWPEQQGYLQVHRISHWLCWCDSGIWGWLTFAAAHKVVLAALSPQRRTVTHFLRGWVAPVIRKVKVLCYRLTY